VSLFIHDKLMGHVPNPGFRTSGVGNSFHTIDANGLRHTGTDPGPAEQGAILAVGDSSIDPADAAAAAIWGIWRNRSRLRWMSRPAR
jgi:hypothetical protein